jgi:hypothetical protein
MTQPTQFRTVRPMMAATLTDQFCQCKRQRCGIKHGGMLNRFRAK